jgi:dipeptidyl aminopeptidase/acylaminoacyl peptidase
MRPTALMLGLAAGLAFACPVFAQAAGPFTIDALLRQESFGDARISPDGRWIALERRAPYDQAPSYRLSRDTDRILSSVQIVETRNGAVVHTLEAPDHTAGYSAGRFSPDGRRLVIYELTPQSWRLGIMTLDTGAVRWTELAPEDPRLGLTAVWRNAEELLLVVQRGGQLPEIARTGFQAQERIAALWAATASGRAVGGTFIPSGSARDTRAHRPPLTLVRLNVRTGVQTALAAGAIFDLALSPDRARVAILEDREDLQPDPDRPVLVGDPVRRRFLRLIDIETGVETPLDPSLDYGPYLMAWNPDSRRLLAFAREVGAGDFEQSGSYVVVDIDGAVSNLGGRPATERSPWDEPVALGGWRGDMPVLRLREGTGSAQWRVGAGGQSIPAQPGDRLVEWNGETRIERGDRLVSLAGEPDLAGRITDLGEARDAGFRAAYVREATPGRSLVDGDCVQVAAGPAPRCATRLDPNETRVAISPDGGFVLARQDRTDGLSRLRLHRPDTDVTLAEINADRAAFAWGEIVEIPHAGPAGQALKSWLLLPPGLPDGVRAPLVVEVYPGRVSSRPPSALTRRSAMLQNNPAVIAGGGYAVLYVSLPNPPTGRWIGAALAAQIDSIADAADATGRVQADRYALLGHSYGAFNVLNATPHSDRVAAVIASNGYADLVSAFELPPFFRAAPDEGVPIGQLSGWAETGQAAIGAFPAEAARYVEMSPLFSAADLRAPALLIESDLERPRMGKLFGVLYRLDREAALLTYYGEGHVLASPANLRDLHARILDWLQRYLGPPAGDAALPVARPGL